MTFTRTVTHLLPSPFKTNCFDYAKIGCKSRRDCVEKCKIKLGLSHYNNSVNDDGNLLFYPFHQSLSCEEKFKSPECFSEYYNMKMISDQTNFYNEENSTFTFVRIFTSDEPDTIYTHSPLFYPIEFICFIGGVISLWTGFSVLSMYAYGKGFLVKKQNQINPKKMVNVTVNNNKKIIFISKKNNDTTLKKTRKVIKKNSVIKVTQDQNA